MKNLILLRGPGGAGKSTIGQVLHERTENTVLVDVDELRVSDGTGKSPSFKREQKKVASNLFIKDAMDEGLEVIVADLSYNGYYDELESVAKKSGYELKSFYIHSDLGECLYRNSIREKRLSNDHIVDVYKRCSPYNGDVVVENFPGIETYVADSIASEVYDRKEKV